MAYLALSALELTLSQGKYNNVLIRLCFMATWQACLLSNKRGRSVEWGSENGRDLSSVCL